MCTKFFQFYSYSTLHIHISSPSHLFSFLSGWVLTLWMNRISGWSEIKKMWIQQRPAATKIWMRASKETSYHSPNKAWTKNHKFCIKLHICTFCNMLSAPMSCSQQFCFTKTTWNSCSCCSWKCQHPFCAAGSHLYYSTCHCHCCHFHPCCCCNFKTLLTIFWKAFCKFAFLLLVLSDASIEVVNNNYYYCVGETLFDQQKKTTKNGRFFLI